MRRAPWTAATFALVLAAPLFLAGPASAAPVWGAPELLERNSGNAYLPSVAGDPGGNSTVVWYQYNGTRYNVWANRLNYGQGWTGATLIENLDGNATLPAVSMDARGNAFVVWEQAVGSGPGSKHVWSNRYIAGVGWGNATAVESNSEGNVSTPKVAAFPAGGAISVWLQWDGAHYNVWKALVGNQPSSGWGSQKLVETNDSGNAYDPVVATSGHNKALVSWYQTDGKYYHVWAAKYNGTITICMLAVTPCSYEQWNGPVRVDTLDSSDSDDPAVAMDTNGNGAIVFRQYQAPVYNIWAARYVNSSDSWPTAVRIESTDDGSAYFPKVTYNNLEIFATWEQYNGARSDVWVNRYSGLLIRTWGTATILDTGAASARRPEISSDSTANVTVAWYQTDGLVQKIWSSRYLRGDGWQTARLVENDASGHGNYPVVAANGLGAAVVSWIKNDGTTNNIWAARVREATTPFAPQGLSALAANREVALTWQAPLDDGGGAVSGYRVYRGTSPGTLVARQTLGVEFFFNDTNLTNGVTYYYQVRALNALGEGTGSSIVNATPVAVPSLPLNVTLTPGLGMVTTSWTAPADPGGSNVTEYFLYRGQQGDPIDPLGSAGLSLNYTDTSVVAGTIYCYQVAARNAAGEGLRSLELCAAPQGPPSQPQSLVAAAGTQLIQLTWAAPATDGGASLIRYEVYRSDAGAPYVWVATSAVTNGTVLNQAGLQNGVNYCYEVSAVNAVGEGARSLEACATPSGLPSAPLSFSAVAGNREVNLAWSQPADSGGLEVAGYRIYRRTPTAAETLVAELGPVLSWRDTGLVNGETYHYQATAVAVAGEGPRSQNASAVPSGLPSPPLAFTVSASAAGVASLQWAPPYDDGGFAITTYRLHRGPDVGNMTLYRDAGSVFVFDDTGLPVGVVKCYAVAAVTSRGEGAYADTLCVIPKGLPSQPTNASGQANGSTIRIQWGLPTNNGSDVISGFALYRGTTAGSLTLLTSPSANDTSYEDASVMWGHAYFYQVAAVNGVGEGARTAEMRVPSGDHAASPAGFSTVGTGGVVTLTWSAPQATGGWPVTGYRIYRTEVLELPQQGPRQLVAELGLVSSYTDQNVTVGHQYDYEVVALTEIGEGQAAQSTAFVLAPAAGGDLLWLLLALAAVGVVGAVVARKYALGRGAGGAVAVQAASGSSSIAAPVVASGKPGEGSYLVENVFLLYQDGRAIFTRGGLGADAVDDPEVIGAMLVAVQDFVQDSFKKGASIDRMSYGDDSILLERGRHVILAVTVFGEPDDAFREAMREAVEKVETTYAGVIDRWDGMHETFADVERVLEPLWAPTAALTRSDVILATTVREVRMLSATEFFQGFVRLKVSVVNSTGSVITGATVDVDYNSDVLRLHKVEPATYKTAEAKVSLGVINTAEKVTLAYYFDPQICTSSALEGTCRYKDHTGAFHTIKMKSRTAEVVCPLFFTKEHANPAMLKRLIEGSLNQFDIKAYEFKEGAHNDGMKSLFELMKTAVGAHDVQAVRSFEAHRPYLAEAWYYGKTQKGYDVVVRCLVDAAQHRCEFFAGSTSMQAVTGLLAELSHTLDSSTKQAAKVAGLELRPLFDESVRERYADRQELSKSLDGSLPAGDIAGDGPA